MFGSNIFFNVTTAKRRLWFTMQYFSKIWITVFTAVPKIKSQYLTSLTTPVKGIFQKISLTSICHDSREIITRILMLRV